MKEKFIRAVRKSGTSLAVNIPSEIVKLLGLNRGDTVRVEVEKIK